MTLILQRKFICRRCMPKELFIKALEKIDKRKREKLQMQAVYDMLKKQHQWNIFMLIYAIVMTLIVVSIILYGSLYGYIVIG